MSGSLNQNFGASRSWDHLEVVDQLHFANSARESSQRFCREVLKEHSDLYEHLPLNRALNGIRLAPALYNEIISSKPHVLKSSPFFSVLTYSKPILHTGVNEVGSFRQAVRFLR